MKRSIRKEILLIISMFIVNVVCYLLFNLYNGELSQQMLTLVLV